MTLKHIAVAAALAVSPVALAQTVPPQAGQAIPPQAGQAGETSDRTPDKATQTPQAQQDTADGKTSDRTLNRAGRAAL